MKKLDLKETARESFNKFRPDEAYSFDEVYEQFIRWRTQAFLCKRGDIICMAGDAATHFGAVVSGALQVRVPSELGEDILLRVIRPGEYVGVEYVFSPRETYDFDLVAATETTFLSFDVKEVRKWRSDPKSHPLYDNLGKLLSESYREAQQKAMILSGADISERLRRFLAVRMQKENSRTISFPGTAADLAKYLGVNKCALSRTIGRLRAEGKIEFKHNVFRVL